MQRYLTIRPPPTAPFSAALKRFLTTRTELTESAFPSADSIPSPQKALEALTAYKAAINDDDQSGKKEGRVLANHYIDAIITCRVNKCPTVSVQILHLAKSEKKVQTDYFSGGSVGLKVGELSQIFEHAIYSFAESDESSMAGEKIAPLVDMDSDNDDDNDDNDTRRYLSLKSLGLQSMQLMGEKNIPHSMAHYSGLILLVNNHSNTTITTNPGEDTDLNNNNNNNNNNSNDTKNSDEKHRLIMRIVDNLLGGDVAHFPINPSDPCLPIMFSSSCYLGGAKLTKTLVHKLGMVSPSNYEDYKSLAFLALKSRYVVKNNEDGDGDGDGDSTNTASEDACERALALLKEEDLNEWGGGDLLAMVMDVLTLNDRNEDALQLFYADYKLPNGKLKSSSIPISCFESALRATCVASTRGVRPIFQAFNLYQQFFAQHSGVSIVGLELMLSRCEIDKDFETSLNLLENVEGYSSKALASCLRSLDNDQYREEHEVTRTKLQDLFDALKLDLKNSQFLQNREVACAFMKVLFNSRRYSNVVDTFYAAKDLPTPTPTPTPDDAEDTLYPMLITTIQSLAKMHEFELIFHILDNYVDESYISPQLFEVVCDFCYTEGHHTGAIDAFYGSVKDVSVNFGEALSDELLGTALLASCELRECLLAENFARLMSFRHLNDFDNFDALAKASREAVRGSNTSREKNKDEIFNPNNGDIGWYSAFAQVAKPQHVEKLCKAYRQSFRPWKAETILTEIAGVGVYVTEYAYITTLDSVHPELRVMRKNLCRGEPLVSFYDLGGEDFQDISEEDLIKEKKRRKWMLEAARKSIINITALGLEHASVSSRFHDCVIRNFRSLRMVSELVDYMENTMPEMSAPITSSNYITAIMCASENNQEELKAKLIENATALGLEYNDWGGRSQSGLLPIIIQGEDFLGHT